MGVKDLHDERGDDVSGINSISRGCLPQRRPRRRRQWPGAMTPEILADRPLVLITNTFQHTEKSVRRIREAIGRLTEPK